jgi:hypothetical protein
MNTINTDYDLLQDQITKMLEQHGARDEAMDGIYTRAITQEIGAMIDADMLSADDIETAITDLVRQLGSVTDHVAYQVLNRARELVKVQQYFYDKHGFSLDLGKEYERLTAIQANTFDAFSNIPKDTGEAIRTLLSDNEVMGMGKAAVNEEITRIAGVTASRAKLISGTSEQLYIGQFNANKAKDLNVQKFQYKPDMIIKSSRPFTRWVLNDHGAIFTKAELDDIDAKDWGSLPGIPIVDADGWEGIIPGVPVLVQGGGHRFALLFDY